MNDGIKALVQGLGKCLLPYPDPIRRRRLQREARVLVSWNTWPGDDATPREVAELTLLRLLWLQRQVHDAARYRQKDATALLARASIETCITGIWCLYGVETVPRLRSQNAHALRGMMKNFVGSLVSQDFLDHAVSTIGTPKGPLTVANMVDVVIEAGGPVVVTNLYEKYYVPASSVYAHGGGVAMLRHVGKGGVASEVPSSGWLRRSAVHVADGCVGVLAGVVAMSTEQNYKSFETYAYAHLSRALAPFASMGGGESLRSLRPKSFPRAYRGYRNVQAYFNSESYQTDSSETSQVIIRTAIEDMLSLFKRDRAGQARLLMLDELVKQLSEYDPSKETSQPGRCEP